MNLIALLALSCIVTNVLNNPSASAGPSGVLSEPQLKGEFLIRNEDGSLTNPRFVGSSPAIGADGTIYIASNDNRFFALHPDGSIKWVIDGINPRYRSIPAIGQDGTIYLTRGESLSAFSQDGEVLWNFPLVSTAEIAPAIAADGTIIVAAEAGILYAVHPDGTLRWKYHFNNSINTCPVIGPDGVIYIGGIDHFLYALNSWGTLKWQYRTHSSVNYPVVAADGTILFTCQAILHALNPDGTLKWITGAGYSGSPVIGADGTIYIGGSGGSGALHALNPDGSNKWTNTETGSSNKLALGADGNIYASGGDEILKVFDTNGALLWSYQLTLYSTYPVLAPDGALYITAEHLHAFSTDSGGYDTEAVWPNFMANGTRCITAPGYEPPPLHTISGAVVMPDSTPVAGMAVSIGGLTTESGEDGSFSFVAPDGEYAIDIDTETSIIPRRVYVTVDGDDAIADVLQAGRHTVTGRLMVHGSPLAGKRVYVADMETLTGPDGRFSMRLSDGDHTLEFDREELYFPAMKDITVTGLDLETGDIDVYPIIAKYPTSRSITNLPFWVKSVMYVVLDQDTICRVDEAGYTEVFEFDDDVYSRAIGEDGSMVFCGDEKWYGLNPDFTLRWEYPLETYDSSTPIITDTAIYLPARGYVLEVTPDGDFVWRREFDTGANTAAQLVLGDDGTLYVACYPGELHACNPDGTIRWTFSSGGNIHNYPVVTPDGTILFGSYDYHFYAVNPDGGLKWKYNMGNMVTYNPEIGPDGAIYIGNNGGEVVALTPDGELIWFTPGIELLWGSAYDTITGELWCRIRGFTLGVDPADGSVIWKHPFEMSRTVSPDGDVYALYNGAIYAIDTNPEEPLSVEERDTGQTDMSGEHPAQARLHPNHPNPFNPSTMISFTLPEPGDVRLSIYSIAGQLVRELATGQFPAGTHELVWDGRDDTGMPVSSGIYFARLHAGGRTAIRRMVLVR